MEDVLLHVRRWHEAIRSPQSLYYLFILTSLLGFGCPGIAGNREMLVEACRLKNEVTHSCKWSVHKPWYPREWLGKDCGIKILYRFFVESQNTQMNRSSGDKNSLLQLVKGTTCICEQTHKFSRKKIAPDLGNNTITVEVAYMPSHLQFSVGDSVQFTSAFSLRLGYEDIDVASLKKYKCSACQGKVELTTREISASCKCGAVIGGDKNLCA